MVIGADGIHSAIKAQMHPTSKPKYTGWVIWRGAVPAAKFTYEDLPREVTRTYGDSSSEYLKVESSSSSTVNKHLTFVVSNVGYAVRGMLLRAMHAVQLYYCVREVHKTTDF